MKTTVKIYACECFYHSKFSIVFHFSGFFVYLQRFLWRPGAADI